MAFCLACPDGGRASRLQPHLGLALMRGISSVCGFAMAVSHRRGRLASLPALVQNRATSGGQVAMQHDAPLWTPTSEAIETAPLSTFAARAAKVAGRTFSDYEALHRWSVEEREAFWSLVWDH